MEKTYTPQQLEQQWYQTWEQAGYFLPQNSSGSGSAQPYCIMLPPPNVTGTLHMGHGFQVSLMDALIRYRRMCGDNVLWQVGTDHAGIATQMVVERRLLQEGIKRHELGRDAFVERIWQWKEQSDNTIKGQLRRMGASVDWSRECFSMDEPINQAVIQVFVELYEQQLIYRGKRLVNWDPVLLTAISDLEVVAQEEEGFLWYVRYPVENDSNKENPDSNEITILVVATTRPETILGDTAIAVHPDDVRYQSLIGKQVQHPLTGRTIPVIADEYVDPEFGTGCLKITPAHDFNDYAVGQRHGLAILNVFTPNAHINDADYVPLVYRGLERYQARQRIVADLQHAGLLEKVVKHTLQVPRGDRSGAVIEPYLTDQWYINTQSLAGPAISAVQENQIQFVPENWTKTYFQWLENIEDWCISRQLWWGHRIPAWYDEQGNVYVAESEASVRQKYQLDANLPLHQDEDVLDTWVSASLWPFVTLGWPRPTPELQTFYPTSVLVTGFDILFFWVARMVMMGLKFTGQIPFHTVYISGLIRDREGQKMSKSKGNILDPIDLIDGIELEPLIAKRTLGLMQPEQAKKIAQATRLEFPDGIPAFGTDALRFTYCALANTGRDIRFDLGRIGGYRNFCNKLWNAARYVLLNLEGQPVDLLTDHKNKKIDAAEITFSVTDRWIQAQLQTTIAEVTQAFTEYRFDLLAQALYEFTWNEYCDWYVELAKPILLGSSVSPAQQRGTRYTLVTVLETLLRLLHPLMPFITEEIWQQIAPLAGKSAATIMLQSYPVWDATQQDENATATVNWLKKMVLHIRQIRGEMNIAPGKLLPLILQRGSDCDRIRVQENAIFLTALAKLTSITWLADDEVPPDAATALVDQLALFIPLAGLIDKEAELLRLQKELDKLTKELARATLKLDNPDYVGKAPLAVVTKERQRAQELQEAMAKLRQQQASLRTT